MTRRSWRWLRVRIEGLLTRPHMYDPAGRVMWTTRLQHALFPPPPTENESNRQRS